MKNLLRLIFVQIPMTIFLLMIIVVVVPVLWVVGFYNWLDDRTPEQKIKDEYRAGL